MKFLVCVLPLSPLHRSVLEVEFPTWPKSGQIKACKLQQVQQQFFAGGM